MAPATPKNQGGADNRVVEDLYLGRFRIARVFSDVAGQRVAHNALVRPAVNRKKYVLGAPHAKRLEPAEKVSQKGPEHQPVQAPATDQAPAADQPLSPEETARLVALKGENKTWKDISNELNRPVPLLKEQWKAMKHEHEQVQKQSQGQHQVQPPAQKNGKQKEKGKENGQADHKHSVTKGTMNLQVRMPAPDEHLNHREINMIHAIIEDQLPDFWLRVATAFYNAADREIHPDDIRDTFTGLP